MTNREELKPCPFCRSKKEYIRPQERTWGTGGWYVLCFVCGTMGPIERNQEAAIAAWNNRENKQEE